MSKNEIPEKENERDSEAAVPRKGGKGNCLVYSSKKRKHILSIQVGK